MIVVAAIQAVYFIVTGVWPLLHMRSFLAVTGPKMDLWLVKTVGVLVTCIGAAIGLAAWRGNVPVEVRVLAVTSAAALAGVNVNYVARRVIAPIYLLDAAAEIVLIAAWLLT
jgi:hypothetical protein